MSTLSEIHAASAMRDARITELQAEAESHWKEADALEPFVPRTKDGLYIGDSAQYAEFNKKQSACRAAKSEIKELEQSRQEDGSRLESIRREALDVARQAARTYVRLAELDSDVEVFRAHLKDAKGATREALAQELAGCERDYKEVKARYPTLLEKLKRLVGHDNWQALIIANLIT